MLILGIESSCDETAAAVVRDGGEVVSSVVSSQARLHSPYGGVVPELASRHHLDNIIPVVDEALDRAGLRLDDIDALAATRGPGLIGALLVGLSFAKAAAICLGKPLAAVDHLQAHVAAAFLEPLSPKPPFVALVVSGGHTSLFRVESPTAGLTLLGQTLDDAAGEAFDKVGKLLGLAYPAGPAIERLAKEGRDNLALPRPLTDPPPQKGAPRAFDFSFSGLKTAVLNFVQGHPVQQAGREAEPGQTLLADVCASFQEAVVDVLALKTVACARAEGVAQVALVGGVAANGRLRQKLGQDLAAAGLELLAPPLDLCTDNAAMVAAAGYYQLCHGAGPTDFGFDALSRIDYPV